MCLWYFGTVLHFARDVRQFAFCVCKLLDLCVKKKKKKWLNLENVCKQLLYVLYVSFLRYSINYNSKHPSSLENQRVLPQHAHALLIEPMLLYWAGHWGCSDKQINVLIVPQSHIVYTFDGINLCLLIAIKLELKKEKNNISPKLYLL